MKTGTDVRISPHAVIVHPDLVEIGDHVAIDPFTVITTAAAIGSYIHIAPHCSIIGGRNAKLVMKDFSGLSAGCRIICSSDDFKGGGIICPFVPMKYRAVTFSTVTLERFAQLGTNVILMPGITVGEGAVAGAGALITKDMEPWGIYIGSPARKVGERRKDKILAYAEEILKGQSGTP
ncbi:MAG: acyltransferase [Verrucomicrobia bacterium]|nr:acyltransferase [Verrucomicrobiota bacterium]